MNKLYVIRHGETDYNREGRYLGRTDISLNLVGRQQVEDVRTKISEFEIDIIISSPLKRTIETVEIINTQQKDIVIDSNFIERGVGVYEGLTRKEAKENFPELWNKKITQIFDDAPIGGETIQEVQNRVFQSLDSLKEEYDNCNILISTHAFTARVINKYFNQQMLDEEFYSFILKNAEIRQYEL